MNFLARTQWFGIGCLLFGSVWIAGFLRERSLSENKDTPALAAGFPSREVLPKKVFMTNRVDAGFREHGDRPRVAGGIPEAEIPMVLSRLSRAELVSDFSQSLVRRWAEREPAKAAHWAARIIEPPAREAMLHTIIVVWANTDLAAAKGWLLKQPAGTERQGLALAMANEAMRADPVEALRLTDEIPAGKQQDDLQVQAVGEWAGHDFQAAYQWASQFPEGDLRDRLITTVAVALAEQDGPAAADLATKSLPRGEEQDRAVVSIIQRWGQRDPGEVAAWVERFPPGQLRDAAVENLLGLWMEAAPEEAGAWLSGLRASPLREQAVAIYQRKLAVLEAGEPAFQSR